MNNKQNILLAALILTPVLLLGTIIWYSWGYHSGTEFSPDDFTRRVFTYNQDPLFGFVLKGREYDDVTSSVDQELILDNWIQPLNRKNKTWHLIHDNQVEQQPSEADARFLTSMLDLRTENYEYFWTVWNGDYPQLAKVFWPIVAEMARDEMYLVIPDVMNVARNYRDQDLATFQQRLDRVLAQSYRQMGKLDLDLGRFDRAKYRLNKANQLEPDPTLQRWIEQCEAKLPESSAAQLDVTD